MKRQEPWPDRFYTGTCNNGHERTPENTYITKKPYGGIKRQCRICRNQPPETDTVPGS